MGFGAGIASSGHSVMAHGSLHAAYLRYDRWGVYLSAEANGRLKSYTSSNSMQNVRGFTVSACYNLLPMTNYKVLFKLGLSKNFGQMMGDYVGTISNHDPNGHTVETKQFRKSEFDSYGVNLGVELLPSGYSQRWSISSFINLNRQTYFGMVAQYNLGMM